MIITDTGGHITYVNRAYRERTGLSEEQLRGSRPRILRTEPDRPRGGSSVWETLKAGDTAVRTDRKQDRQGRWLDIEQRVAPVAAGGGETARFVIIGRGISERVQAEEALTELATTDRLTGLNNRLRFEELLGAELERFHRHGHTFSLALFDIDDFKLINDNHGHETGDNVLRELGELLANHTRSEDVVGRWGGEEFTLLLPDTSHAAARQAAQKLAELAASHAFTSSHGITLSCGVTDVASNDSIKALLRRADRALYRAKENGKNQVDVELAN